MKPTEPLPTSFCDERYAVTRVLGEGGQATSFEAVDKKHGQLVVVKRYRVRGAASWKDVELAEREARVLSALQHPSLPRYVDHFEEGGELFLVTELIEGETIAAHRGRGASFDEQQVIRFLREASSVLDYLHGRAPPVVHRDIKPSNVLCRKDGSFAIIDFGAVRDRMKPEGGSTIVGTFGYMAPEQFQGRAMPVSDVYAVAATALVMLTGSEPEALPHKGLAIDVEAALRPRNASPQLIKALSAMLDPDPDRRAPRIAPLLAAIESAAEPEAHAPSRKKRERERKEAERSRKREDRSKRKRGRHPDWVRGYGMPIDLPLPVRAIVQLALRVARFAVRVALRSIVMPLLTAMSLIFGRELRKAAATVGRAEREAQDEIARAAAWAIPGAPLADEARARVAAQPATQRDGRVRVGDAATGSPALDADVDAEAEAEREAAGHEPDELRKRRRR